MKSPEKRKGFVGLPVRFFAWIENEDSEDLQHDICEVTEAEFIEAEGEISYERHTIFANGVAQICLTKAPRG